MPSLIPLPNSLAYAALKRRNGGPALRAGLAAQVVVANATPSGATADRWLDVDYGRKIDDVSHELKPGHPQTIR